MPKSVQCQDLKESPRKMVCCYFHCRVPHAMMSGSHLHMYKQVVLNIIYNQMDNITPTMHCMWSGVHFSYLTEAEAEVEEVEVRIHSLLIILSSIKFIFQKRNTYFTISLRRAIDLTPVSMVSLDYRISNDKIFCKNLPTIIWYGIIEVEESSEEKSSNS